MITLLICMTKQKEADVILEMSKNTIALISNEELEILNIGYEDEAKEKIKSLGVFQAVIIDITHEKGIWMVESIREEYPQVEILIIADTTISPVRYLNPKVKASSLLLKPFQRDMVKETILGFFRQFIINQTMNSQEDFFRLRKRGKDFNISCKQILYLEARDKKLYLKCAINEYVIYETLDSALEQLPDYFMRCHRSFLVNRLHIQNVKYAENIISLDNDEMIPLSRSYKNVLKEALANE